MNHSLDLLIHVVSLPITNIALYCAHNDTRGNFVGIFVHIFKAKVKVHTWLLLKKNCNLKRHLTQVDKSLYIISVTPNRLTITIYRRRPFGILPNKPNSKVDSFIDRQTSVCDRHSRQVPHRKIISDEPTVWQKFRLSTRRHDPVPDQRDMDVAASPSGGSIQEPVTSRHRGTL